MSVYDPHDSMLVSKTWAARALRISIDALSRWPVKPARRKGQRTWFDIRDLFDHLRNRTEGATATLSRERAELARQQRLKLERDADVLAGRLLDAETVAGEWCNVFVLIRQRLLNTVARVEQIADDDTAELVRNEIHKSLDELARHGSDHHPAAQPGDIPDASPRKRQRVGRQKQGAKRGGRGRTGNVAH